LKPTQNDEACYSSAFGIFTHLKSSSGCSDFLS
jgi:hypothetical protein